MQLTHFLGQIVDSLLLVLGVCIVPVVRDRPHGRGPAQPRVQRRHVALVVRGQTGVA